MTRATARAVTTTARTTTDRTTTRTTTARTTTATPRSTPRPTGRAVPARPELRLVPSVPARTRPRVAPRFGSGRAPFVLLVVALLVGTTLGLLILNTAIAVDSLKATQLRAANAERAQQVQSLEQRVVAGGTPERIAAAAAAAGMVPAGPAAFLVIAPDGSSTLRGTPEPAAAPPAPASPSPASPSPDSPSPAAPSPATQSPAAQSPAAQSPTSPAPASPSPAG
jgi:hypothetical protein